MTKNLNESETKSVIETPEELTAYFESRKNTCSGLELLREMHENANTSKHIGLVKRETEWMEHVDCVRFHNKFRKLPCGLQLMLMDFAVDQHRAINEHAVTDQARFADEVFDLMDKYNVLPFSADKIRIYIMSLYFDVHEEDGQFTVN